jgi:hypothetical protein
VSVRCTPDSAQCALSSRSDRQVAVLFVCRCLLPPSSDSPVPSAEEFPKEKSSLGGRYNSHWTCPVHTGQSGASFCADDLAGCFSVCFCARAEGPTRQSGAPLAAGFSFSSILLQIDLAIVEDVPWT